MTLLFAIYNLSLEVVTWLVLVPWSLARRLLGGTPASEIGERLGRRPDLPLPPQGAKRLIIHAVSVGEMAAAAPLVRSLERLVSDSEIVLTAGNRHGVEAARRIAAGSRQVISVSFLPWDRRRAVAAWLAHVRPNLVAVVETEIWPNLFLACREQGVRLCMVNGRVYPADLPRYRFARRFFASVLGCVDWFGAQSAKDRDRLITIGADAAKVDVETNLKYDAVGCLPAVPRPFPDDRRVIVAGSTHAPEEEQLLRAFGGLRARRARLLLVLAPRHPARAPAIAQAARHAGFSVGCISEDRDDPDVLVVDRMGVLASLYPHAELVFVEAASRAAAGRTRSKRLLPGAASSSDLTTSISKTSSEISRPLTLSLPFPALKSWNPLWAARWTMMS